ncbi:MAG TPA: hypothetical protein PKW90_12565, partial [Myxococcota bacterium]|nr:hypothetical protein [Myxococcota bacterium]
MSVATGPSLKGTNSFQQQGGGGDPQSQATAKGENAAVTFQKDLGKVTNLDGLCKAVGGVLDATTDEDNGTISGKLSANLRLPIPGTGAGYVELRTELAVSGSASALKGPTLPTGSD